MQLLGGNFSCFPRTFAWGDHSGGNHIGRYFLPHQETSPGGRLVSGERVSCSSAFPNKGTDDLLVFRVLLLLSMDGKTYSNLSIIYFVYLTDETKVCKTDGWSLFSLCLNRVSRGGWDVCRKRKGRTTSSSFG